MKKPRVILIILLAIILIVPLIPQVKSIGYGEENENLGQFTDDFENTDNITVMDDVIRNATLQCIELNFTVGFIPNYENFSKYTEVDPGVDITVIDTRITWTTMIRNVADYVYEDYGIANFGDFEFQFNYTLTDVEAGDASNQNFMAFVALANHFGAFNPAAGIDWLACVAQQSGATDDKFRFRIAQYTGGINDFFVSGAVRDIGTYYLTFNRTGIAIFLKVYSDIARTNLLETLTDGGNGDNTAYRYLHGIQSWNSVSDPNDHSTGYIEYLWNGSLLGGYEADGYFLTEDYLNYTTGNGLTLLSNSTIPESTTLSVQFSNDNSTWVDNEGNVGSTTIHDGFYSIDLRDLNYTDIFLMYTFTSSHTNTSRLYQSRLITTEGTAETIIQNITGEWIYYNLTSINVNIGTHDAGNLASTFVVDGDTYDISETVGAPAWLISFNWTNVDINANSMWVVLYSFYSGNQKHDIDLQLYNFTSSNWADIEHIPDMAGYEWTNASIYDLRIPNDFINSTGAVLGRIIHVAAGNINHDILIDFLRLHIFVPFEQICPPTPTPTNGVADTTWIIFLAIGLIFMLSIAFLYVKNK